MKTGRVSSGHPVDVASGALYSTHIDYELSGRASILWERYYNTELLHEPPSPLGPGWTTRYFMSLTRKGNEYCFRGPQGSVDVFHDLDKTLEIGGRISDLGSFQELSRQGRHYVVTCWDPQSGELERYLFNPSRGEGALWPLVALENESGQGMDLTYDEQGRLVSIRQRREGRAIVLHYDSNGRIALIESIAGEFRKVVTRYEYDNLGRLLFSADSQGQTYRYAYDAKHRMIQELSSDGALFRFKYDDRGRCVKTSGPEGYDQKTFRFLDQFQWTEVTNSLGKVWRFHWLPSGQVDRIVTPLGAQTLTRFDEHGRIIEEIDANNAATIYRYDEAGNLGEVINPLGHTIKYTYNAHRQTTSIVDAAGSTWIRTYDKAGNLISTKDPEGNNWYDHFDAKGDLVRQQNALGATRTMEYNQSGDEVAQTDWHGHRTLYSYDAEGRMIGWVSSQGESGSIERDQNGRIKTLYWPDNNQVRYAYDAAGNLSGVTDENENVNRYNYGPCGLLLEKTDALGNSLKLAWGTEPGQLLALRNENGETCRFEYDDDGRMIKETGFDGAVRTYQYDSVGFCTAFTNALGETTSFERDAHGRVVRKMLPDGTEATFEYNPLGYLLKAVNSASAVEISRDRLGRPVQERQNEHLFELEYDPLGNRKWLRTSLGTTISYGYDKTGRLGSIALDDAGQYGFDYDAFGKEVKRYLPGGLQIDSRYDERGRLIERAIQPKYRALPFHALAATFSQYVFRYGKNSNVLERRLNSASTAYSYDPLGQLLAALPKEERPEVFEYDAAGNIARCNGANWIYGAGSRLEKAGDTVFRFDAEGRIIRKTTGKDGESRSWEYTYNGAGELSGVKDFNGLAVTFKYDALGRRVEKRTPDSVIHFLWDDDVLVHEVRQDEEQIDYVFKPGSFEPILQRYAGAVYSYVVDQVGAPLELIDGSGEVAWSCTFHAWGKVKDNGRPAAEMPFRFQGQYYDSETGLHYNRYRYYDPDTGRYISQDPVGLNGGINLYRYGPNPTWWVDPYGLNGDDVQQNKADGTRRETERAQELRTEYPDDSVQREQYLRDADGKIVRDPLTGEARRVDIVVIDEDGSRVRRLEEVTSPTADKRSQAAKEGRIRAAGGQYVRDRRTRKLVKIGSRQRIHCHRRG